MMLPQAFVTFTSALSAIALNALWEDALLVLSIGLMLRLWPHLNAATRYTVWSATLVAAFAIPLATTLAFFEAPYRSSAPAVRSGAHPAQPPAQAPTAARLPAAHPAVSQLAPRQASGRPRRLRVTLPLPLTLAIFVIWLALAGYAVVKLIVGLVRLEQLKRDALPLSVEYRDAMPQWTRANKGARDVRLCVSDQTDVPVAVGLFDAMILVPHTLLDRFSEGEVDQICLHELAHLHRADDWTNGFQRLIIALLGWNPAAQFVGHQLDLEREVACDDWVLSFVGMVRPYALCLTKMAERASWPRHPIPAPGVFATRKHISLRIERLLGSGRNAATNLSAGPAAAAIAAIAALALAIGLVAPSVAAPYAVTAPMPVSGLNARSTLRPKTAVPEKTRTVVREVRVVTYATPRIATAKPQAIGMTALPAPPAEAAPGLASRSIDGNRLADDITKEVREGLGAAVGSARATGEGRNCSGCDFGRVDWSSRDLHGVHYNGVNLSGARLVETNFSGGDFNGVDFSKANLHGASFRNARLIGCDFADADLTGADFTGARLSGCQFTGAQLTSSALRDVLNNCTGCDFSRASLRGLDLSNVRANGDDFTRADLRGVNFANAQLTGMDFSGARMDGANLGGATLRGCALDGVDLSSVDLSRTKIIDTEISTKRRSPP